MNEATPADLLANLEERQDALLQQLRELNDRLEAALARLTKSKGLAAESEAVPATDVDEQAVPHAPTMNRESSHRESVAPGS